MNSLLRAGSKALGVVGGRGFAAASVPDRKVVILGAAGGIGQPLGLLMKVMLIHFSFLGLAFLHDSNAKELTPYTRHDSESERPAGGPIMTISTACLAAKC